MDADLRDPEKIVKEAARTLDFSQPAAVILVAVLHFIAFSDCFKINNSATCCFTSRTCSQRPGEEISGEEAGSVMGSTGPLSVVTSERGGPPWPERLMGPGCFYGEARRTSRTPQGPVGKIASADDPAGLVADLGSVLAPGSFVVISHLTADFAPAQVGAGVAAYNALVPAGITARTHREVTALFGDLALVAPGVVPVSEWRPDHAPVRGVSADVYAGLATVRRSR